MYRIVRLFSFLLALSLGSGCGPASPPAETPPPNIIFILADDLGYGDLSWTGQTHFQTPHLDRLAEQGMFFRQHYSGATVCAPSRSALMTGLHTGHTFVRGNKEVLPEGQHPLPDSALTIAELLQQQGYATGAFGKWGLGFPGSEGDPNQQGFDEFFGYNCQRFAHHYFPRHLWENQNKIELPANAGTQKGLYAPALIQEKTLAFIDQHQEQPFFLFVPAVMPHAELVAPDSLMEKYRGSMDPETPYEGYDEGEKYRNGPYESQAEPHAAFAAMIDLLDQQVGEIINKVEALGLADNTLILFSSDNGPHLEGGADPDYFDSNGPFKGYKRDLYEGGIRVPTIAYWPGTIAAGSQSDHISAFWDLFPTFAELAGAPIPEGLDGISMLPTLLQKPGQAEHSHLYWEFHEKGGRIAVRKGPWKAVKYNYLAAPEAPAELYHLERDPGETQNLAEQEPDIRVELEVLMSNSRTPSPVFRFGAN
ncbi:MAG: arylsulfatase [Bacteroidota bacterium]